MNFARNYADLYLLPLGVTRVAYLDADTIVQGDVGELWAAPLPPGHVAAVARSCTLATRQLFNFTHPLGALQHCVYIRGRGGWFARCVLAPHRAATPPPRPPPRPPAAVAAALRPDDCYINAGVVVLDLEAYRLYRIRDRIAELTALHAAGQRLWLQGVQQPSFVLAMAGRTAEVDGRWNTDALGFNPNKAGRKPIRCGAAKKGRGGAAFRGREHAASAASTRQRAHQPPAPCPARSPCALRSALVLHWNGVYKPWACPEGGGDCYRQYWQPYSLQRPRPMRDWS
jgi:hypothetical protein